MLWPLYDNRQILSATNSGCNCLYLIFQVKCRSRRNHLWETKIYVPTLEPRFQWVSNFQVQTIDRTKLTEECTSSYQSILKYIGLNYSGLQRYYFSWSLKLCLMDFKTLQCWYFLSVPKTRLMLKFLNLMFSPRPKFQFYLERNDFFQHIRLQTSWGRLTSNSYEWSGSWWLWHYLRELENN